MAPHEYEALSREERLRRIGALFYKAVVISLARKQALAGETDGDSPDGTAVLTPDSLSEEDLALLRRYAGLGEIAPRDATEFWGVCRTTAYRRLLSLERGGWIVRHGATTATRYTLTQEARALVKQDEQAKQSSDDSRVRTWCLRAATSLRVLPSRYAPLAPEGSAAVTEISVQSNEEKPEPDW